MEIEQICSIELIEERRILTDYFFLPPIGQENIEILVLIIIFLCQFNSFGVVLIKVADIESISSVDLSFRRYDRRRQFNSGGSIPVQTGEEGVGFYFLRSPALTS